MTPPAWLVQVSIELWQLPNTGLVWALQVVWHVRTRMHARTTVLFSSFSSRLAYPSHLSIIIKSNNTYSDICISPSMNIYIIIIRL